jgi:hypothetical protein
VVGIDNFPGKSDVISDMLSSKLFNLFCPFINLYNHLSLSALSGLDMDVPKVMTDLTISGFAWASLSAYNPPKHCPITLILPYS